MNQKTRWLWAAAMLVTGMAIGIGIFSLTHPGGSDQGQAPEEWAPVEGASRDASMPRGSVTDHAEGAADGANTGRATQPAQPQRANDMRPHIMLVSLDTLRPDHLNAYGYTTRQTSPNLDKLASAGVLFRDVTAQAPWTLPSHMSLLTSMLPSSNGVETLQNVLMPTTPYLPELLHQSGYHTAALVNDAQVRAHWGYPRGFDLWREYKVDTPEGAADHITDEAVAWLVSLPSETQTSAAQPRQPFFLFLHYYDVHDPYDPPAKYREKFDAQLVGEAARMTAWRGRRPDEQLSDDIIDQLKRAYDGEIAGLDEQLGRLFAAAPDNTLIVVFSDHGEAFEEHGWMLHGATLHTEETHVVLLMQYKGAPADATPMNWRGDISQPTMLLDVAPTLLDVAGLASPPTFEGQSLLPAMVSESSGENVDAGAGAAGQVATASAFESASEAKTVLATASTDDANARPIYSETKAIFDGRIHRSVRIGDWKAIYTLLGDRFADDGRIDLYELDQAGIETPLKDDALKQAARDVFNQWMAGEQYWVIRAVGTGEFEATIRTQSGRIDTAMPVNFDPRRDRFSPMDDGQGVQWRAYPKHGDKALYLELNSAAAAAGLTLDLKINGEPAGSQTFLGASHTPTPAMDTEQLIHLTDDLASPAIAGGFEATKPGFYVIRYGDGRAPTSESAPTKPMSDELIRQLRSLGYMP